MIEARVKIEAQNQAKIDLQLDNAKGNILTECIELIKAIAVCMATIVYNKEEK